MTARQFKLPTDDRRLRELRKMPRGGERELREIWFRYDDELATSSDTLRTSPAQLRLSTMPSR